MLGGLLLWLSVVSCGEVALDPVPERSSKQATLTTAAPSLTYLVLGDWGKRGQFYQQHVADQMGRTGEALGSRFVISAGDNFYNDGVQNITDSHWKESFEDVYTHPALHVPWYITLGNHDYKGEIQAQIAYSEFSTRWTLPAPYYDRVETIDDTTSAHFVFLDTNPIHKRHPEAQIQLAWLDSTLTATQTRWTIVVGHHPVYSGGEHGESKALIRSLKPLLEKHRIDAYLSGHDHDLQHLYDENIHYFVSGAAAEVRKDGYHSYTRFTITRPGFLTVAMSASHLDASFVDHLGHVLYSTQLSPRSLSSTQ